MPVASVVSIQILKSKQQILIDQANLGKKSLKSKMLI